MAVEGENLGTAAIYLTVDTTSMDAGIAKAKTKLAGMSAEAEKQYTALSAADRKYAEGQLKRAEMIGKNTAEQIAYNVQLRIGGALGDEIAAKALANAKAVSAAQEEAALSAKSWSDAQLLKANQSLAAYSAQTEAAKAAEAAQAEMAAAEDARFKQIAADATAEVEARKAITAATMDQARANAALAEASGTSAAGGAAKAVGALNATTVQQQIDDYAALDAIMGKKVATTEEVAAAEEALDRLQAQGMLSNEELAQSFAALDVVTGAETKALQANSAAQIENAAATATNSRAQYEIGILLGEAASGNINRLKRSGAALINALGLLQTSAGVAFLGITASIAGMVVAAYKGEEEFSNFNKTMLATGNYAGITFTQYRALVQSLAGSGATIGQAKDALNALAASGKFSGEQFGQAARAALDMSEVTGESVSQSVAAISKLADDPVKAIESLTDQYHFLSTATLQRIQQLQDEGDKQDAENLAEQTYANALRERASQIESNLGTLQKVWRSLGESASFAWDQMQGVGRPATALGDLGAQYDKLLQFRMSVSDRIAGKGTLMDFFNSPDAIGGKSTAGMSLQQQLAAIDAALAKIRGDTKPLQAAADAAAQSKADAAALQQAGNQGVETLAKLGINLDGIKNKQGKVREAATALFNIYRAGGQLPKGVSFTGPIADVPVGPGWDAIKAQLLKGDPAIRAAEEAAKRAAAALATFRSQVDNLTDKSLGVTGDAALTKYVQDVAKLDTEFDRAISKGANASAATEAYWKGSAALYKQYQDQLSKSNDEIKAFTANLDAQLQTRKQVLNLQVQSVGMGSKEAQQQQELLSIQQQYEQKQEQLDREHADKSRGMTDQMYKQESAALKAHYDADVAMTEEYYQKLDQAQSDWVNGAKAALTDFMDEQRNVAAQTQRFTTNFIDGFGNAFASFASGAESAKQAFGSFIDDMYKQSLKFLADKAIQQLLGAFGGGAFGGLGATGPSGFNAGYFGQFNEGAAENTASGIISALGYAKGGVFDRSGSVTAFANGGIVTSPSLFRFANGAGLMGEAGPEAIMPLKRAPNGKLGVEMASPPRSSSVTVNQTIMVGSLVNRRTREQLAQETARRQRIAVARNN